MAGFKTGTYAKVWSVEDKGRFSKVRISVSKKNKDTGNYEQTFSGFCMFVGTAYAGSQQIKVGDSIKLGEIDVTTKFDKAANKEYVNYTVYSFEKDNGAPAQRSAQKPQQAQANTVEENNYEGESNALPF